MKTYRCRVVDESMIRVVEEQEPGKFETIATFATEDEADAFLLGIRYGERDIPEHWDVARETFGQALARVQ